MSLKAVDLVLARLPKEEGERSDVYDDSTGKTVKCPTSEGHLTWGRGYNLSAIASSDLFDVIDRFLLTNLDTKLNNYDWYRVSANIPRQSVFLDMAYNEGFETLLHYPRMLAAATAENWLEASNQCHVKEQVLDEGRYEIFRKILQTGLPA